MDNYITDDEITTYTTMPGVTSADIANATLVIDSYKGRSFWSQTYTEQARLKKKHSMYGDIFKGRLKHLPRVSVSSITSRVPSPLGGFTTETYDTSCLTFDDDEYQYFTFYPQVTTSVFPTIPPELITVAYTAGYTTDTLPTELKRACGLIADNLKKNGGFFNWLSRDDFDMKITLAQNDRILTLDIKKMIDLVKLQ